MEVLASSAIATAAAVVLANFSLARSRFFPGLSRLLLELPLALVAHSIQVGTAVGGGVGGTNQGAGGNGASGGGGSAGGGVGGAGGTASAGNPGGTGSAANSTAAGGGGSNGVGTNGSTVGGNGAPEPYHR